MNVKLITEDDFKLLMTELKGVRTDIAELKQSNVEQENNELNNDLFSPVFISEKLSIPISRIRYWIRHKKISKRKIGRTVLIDIKEVKELMKGDNHNEKVVPLLKRVS